MYKKIVLVCTVLAFSVPFAASAALSQDQISAILSILRAFGVSQSVMANVEAALNGQPGNGGTGQTCLDLSYNLYAGQTDNSTEGEVSKLQQFLGVIPTGYFGPLTEQAVERYQSSHGIVSSGSPDTTGYGFVGPQTRTAMACASPSDQNNNQNQPTQPTVTLTASPAVITAGQSTTLAWSSTNATSCTGTGFSASGTSGSVSVSPSANTTYSMSCSGAGGSAQARAAVIVTTESTQPGIVNNPITDVRHIIPAFNPALDAVQAPSGFGTGQIWHVGPTEQYKSFGAIAGQLKDGDIVEIDAATYKCGTDQSIVWYAKYITVVGVGGRPVFDASGCDLSGDKGIFNPRGDNYIIANIEFMGAHGPSGNDAGIRSDMGGYVYLTDDYFHDNQNGLLFTPGDGATTNLVIDHSEFNHNGSGSGYTHNIYVSLEPHSFVLRFSYSHDAVVGHEVKSRADNNYILYNRIADESSGTASYDIDLPQGGLSYIIGNVIQKSPQAQNGSNITFSVEAPIAHTNPIQEIYIVNNTIVNEDSTPSYRHALFITDNGLTAARFVNNLVVGIPQSQLFTGTGAAKVQASNNVVTDTPGFYDEANRIYLLTANSPAVNAGIDPGTARGFSLAPQYEFALPHDGIPRPVSGALDAGAYEYVAGQTVTPAPTVTFTAAQTSIAFNTPATLTWSTTNATYCTAEGSWQGSQATSGSYTSPALTSNATFALSCTGPSGTVSAAPITITVNDSAQAQALGTYTWKDISNSALVSQCPDPSKFPGISGSEGCVGDLGMTTGVYVPDTNSVYFMGGSESYHYYGNEVYAFNLNTMQPERVTDPTIPADTTEYFDNSANIYTPPYTLAACSRALNLKDGSIARAVDGVVGEAAWDPIIKKIVVGPGGYQRQTGCTNQGGNATDLWTFDPFTKTWAQVAPPDLAFQTVSNVPFFVDPVTGLAYSGGGNRNVSPVGAYLIDLSSTSPTKAIVDNTWPFSATGAVAVDTTHHYALQLIQGSPGSVGLYDLNGLSLTKYGTNGQGGTDGVVGGPGPEFKPDTSWTVTGDTTILQAFMPSFTYNPKLDMFVAWAGTDKFYFIKLDYATKTANIISKHIPGGPTTYDGYGGLAGHLIYIPSLDEYLVFTGISNDFYLLVPPSSSTAMNAVQNGVQLASGLMSFPSLNQSLSLNSTGIQVNVLQQILKRLGLFVGNTTNYFGPKTKAAVELFQLRNGIDPIGIVGPQTRKALGALLLE